MREEDVYIISNEDLLDNIDYIDYQELTPGYQVTLRQTNAVGTQ
jgi:hypothetical protein